MRQRISRRESTFLVFAGLAIVVMLTAFISMNVVVSRNLKQAGDFLVEWKAARTLLFENGEPYGRAVANYVQEHVYGRMAAAGEKPYILTTPMFIVLLYLPAGLAADASIASGAFLFLSEIALILMIMLAIQLTDWQPRRFFQAALFVLFVLSLYSAWALVQASPAVILGLIYAGILVSLRSGADELAGGLIAISLYRWQVGGPFLLLVILWALAQRRARVISGLFMALFILVVISFFVYPGWVMPFLRASLADARWTYGFSTGRILAGFWPEYGVRAGQVLTVLLVVLLLTEWAETRRKEWRRFYWTACLSLAAAPLLAWRGEIQNLVVLLIPLVFILAVVRERWRAGYWLSGVLLLMIFTVPWALLLGGPVPTRLREPLIYLFLPAFTVVGLYWTRWWALRPARTWLERASIGEYR